MKNIGNALKKIFLASVVLFATFAILSISTSDAYAAESYWVTFDSQGGSPLGGGQRVNAGETVTRPIDPTPSDDRYVFSRWCIDKNCNTSESEWDFDNDRVYSDITLYATYSIKSDAVWHVNFDTGVAAAIPTQDITSFNKVTRPADPTHSGYVFAGWYLDQEFTQPYDFNVLVISDFTLYAKFNKVIYRAIANVDRPIVGNTPDTTPTAAAPDMYTATYVDWYLDESPYPSLSTGDTFEFGNDYTVRIKFEANPGYQFADDVVFVINGNDDTSCYGAKTERQYTFTALEKITAIHFNIENFEIGKTVGDLVLDPLIVTEPESASFYASVLFVFIKGDYSNILDDSYVLKADEEYIFLFNGIYDRGSYFYDATTKWYMNDIEGSNFTDDGGLQSASFKLVDNTNKDSVDSPETGFLTKDDNGSAAGTILPGAIIMSTISVVGLIIVKIRSCYYKCTSKGNYNEKE